ncbi:MAG TPA: hypothetical protein PLA18_01230 [Deltaproteobacteria bacterium]|nr:hypothetical protein [Deltaproteobacteria bacterium]
MKKTVSVCFLVLMVFVLSQAAFAAKQTKVEVLYMNHGPLMNTLNDMKGVFFGFGNKISVSWHDFESDDGEKFKAQKGITQHIPLVIWIDGKTTVKVGQKEVKFSGFPTGAGPAFFHGNWTMDDLKKALAQSTAGK